MRFLKRETEKEEVFETEINLREIVSPEIRRAGKPWLDRIQ